MAATIEFEAFTEDWLVPFSYDEFLVFYLLFEFEAFLLKKPLPPLAVLDSYC